MQRFRTTVLCGVLWAMAAGCGPRDESPSATADGTATTEQDVIAYVRLVLDDAPPVGSPEDKGLVVSYQSGRGAWARATRRSGNTYFLPVGQRYGIAVSCFNSSIIGAGATTRIVQLTQRDATVVHATPGGGCAAEVSASSSGQIDSGQIQVTLSNFDPTAFGFVGLRTGEEVGVGIEAISSPFTFFATPGAVDLIGCDRFGWGSMCIDGKFGIARDVVVTANSTTAVTLDPQEISPDPVTIALAGQWTMGGYVSGRLHTKRGAELMTVNQLGATGTMGVIPPALRAHGDIYRVEGSASDPTGWVSSVTQFVVNPSPSISIEPSAPLASASVAHVAGQARVAFTWSRSADVKLTDLELSEYFPGSCGSTTPTPPVTCLNAREWGVTVSPLWLGNSTPESYSLPDLRTVSGLDPLFTSLTPNPANLPPTYFWAVTPTGGSASIGDLLELGSPQTLNSTFYDHVLGDGKEVRYSERWGSVVL